MAAAELRQELKAWERSFAEQHGRKPGREDIKSNPEIEAKYKSYNHATRPAKAKPIAPSPRKSIAHGAQDEPLRERPSNVAIATPRKSLKSGLKPMSNEDTAEPDPTPAFIRCALGPTPQKDGQVLGIFDMLPSASPCKASHTTNLQMTPTKPIISLTAVTPLSARTLDSSKRTLLDAFTAVTPKRKRGEETPSTGRRTFATPSFLRRSAPLASINEDDEMGGLGPPFKRRGVVRSLSSIIQGLRSQEEERLDEELDLLNELEAEERGELPTERAIHSQHTVQVEDSQAPDMPLGPDRPLIEKGKSTEAPGTESLDANGIPRKPYKKKGLKRQTKRVNMRPVLHKPRKEADMIDQADSESEVIAETQVEGAVQKTGDADYSDGSDVEGSSTRSKPAPPAAQPDVDKPKSFKKKISAQAHANFRRLKIKNKNSKANGRGRFGRR